MIDGLHIVRSAKPGKPIRWYIYAWRGGPCIAKRVSPKRPTTLTKDERGAYDLEVQGAIAPTPGTLLALIRSWRGDGYETASPEWKSMEASTRTLWGLHLDLIEAKWEKTPLKFWGDARMVQHIMAWRDSRADTPRAADTGITVLRALLEFGRLRGHWAGNIADDIPTLYRGSNREEIIWTDDEMERFAEKAPQRILDGLRLASLTGLRRADLVGLIWDEVGDHAIVRTAIKKSRGKRRRAVVPLIEDAKLLLAELRTRNRLDGVDNVLVDSQGRAWNAASFSAQFNLARDQAKIVQPGNPSLGVPDRKKHLHDVRGTFCTALCRTNLTDEEIGRIMGWSPQRVGNIRRIYVDDAAIVVALAKRIGTSTVKQPVKRRAVNSAK